MYLNVGEISKALGISAEAIRYYVKEGIITPRQNEENSYWEYSSDDLVRLTDVLFYRSMDLTMKEIKKIMLGAPLEKIGTIIDERRNDLIREIKEKVDALESLSDWKKKYTQELDLIGKFVIGSMPSGFRQYSDVEESEHIARHMKEFFDLDKENWGALSISFFYDMNRGDGKLQRYLSIDGSQKLCVDHLSGAGEYVQEKAERCIITQVHYSDDVFRMIQPVIDYASERGLTLTGAFYGRENTNYFVNGVRSAIYKVYAPIQT